MAAEHEVDRVQHVGGREDIGGADMEEVLLDPETLDEPAGAPDGGTVRNPVGRLVAHRFDLGAVKTEGPPDLLPEGAVVDEGQGSRAQPAVARDVGRDGVAKSEDGGGVFLLAGRLVEL